MVKTKRTRKQNSPEISALKKSLSVALKATWQVEQIRARLEKPKRERGTLAKKVDAQREALEALRDATELALEKIVGVKKHEETPDLVNAFVQEADKEVAQVAV